MELPLDPPVDSPCFISQQERLRLALQGWLQDLPQHRKQLVPRLLQASSSVPLLPLVRE